MVKISLCMIVKDEEKFLENCLRSVKGLVDEIIIVDTGSTDKTKEIASRFTELIFDFLWRDDFSAARNESIKHATSDWILVLDADEALSEKDHEKIKKAVLQNDVEGYLLVQRNYLRKEKDLDYGKVLGVSGLNIRGTNEAPSGFVSAKNDPYKQSSGTAGWLPTPIVRLFRNLPQIKFSGIIHEDVSGSIKGNIVSLPVPIHHYGRINVYSWKRKWGMYELLAEKKMLEEKDYYSLYELGRQYLAGKKIKEAEEMFLKSSLLNAAHWPTWFSLGTISLMRNDLELAEERFQKAIKINPNVVDVYSNLGVVYAQKKEYQKALDAFVLGLNLNDKRADIFKNLGMCYNAMGDKKRAYLSFKKAVELNPGYGEIAFQKT